MTLANEPRRPLLVLVPPLMLDQRSWFRLLEHVPAHVETAFVDLPEGALTRTPENALDGYEAALTELLAREAGHRRVVVVGSSLGAYVAARVLAEVAEPVTHFVALSGCAAFPPELAKARSDLADLIERGAVPVSEVMDALPRTNLDPALVAPALVEWLGARMREVSREALVAALRLTTALADPSRRAGAFTTPSTVFHGRRDESVPFACGEDLARTGPRARFVPLDTSSHLLALTHAADVGAVLAPLFEPAA